MSVFRQNQTEQYELAPAKMKMAIVIVSFPLWLPLALFLVSLLYKGREPKLIWSILIISVMDIVGLVFLKVFVDWPDMNKELMCFYVPMGIYLLLILFCAKKLCSRR